MTSAASALLTAIHAALSADADLAALIGPSGLSDRLKPKEGLPALVIAGMTSDDYSTATEASEEHRLTLAVWSAAEGQREAQTIVARVRARLHDADLFLDGFRLVSLAHRSTQVRRVDRIRAQVAEMVFRAVTE